MNYFDNCNVTRESDVLFSNDDEYFVIYCVLCSPFLKSWQLKNWTEN